MISVQTSSRRVTRIISLICTENQRNTAHSSAKIYQKNRRNCITWKDAYLNTSDRIV